MKCIKEYTYTRYVLIDIYTYVLIDIYISIVEKVKNVKMCPKSANNKNKTDGLLSS